MADEDGRLIQRIFLAQQRLRNHVSKAFSREGIKVTLAQAGILFLLQQEDGRSMGEIGRRLGVDNSTITGLVDRMETAGFVYRQPGVNDRRRFRIHLSPAGREQVKQAEPLVQAANRELAGGMKQGDLLVLTEFLDRIIEGME